MSLSGDASSFTTLVPLHAPAMLRLAAAYVGPAEAEDVVQEAAMRAWQAWPSLRSAESLRPWLLQITVNVCRSWRRGLKRQQQAHLLSLPDDDSQAPALLEVYLGTSDHTGALDLRAAVNSLPPELRSVVLLRFYAGLDATEIGAALVVPPGTVRSRLHRALIQICERLMPPGTTSGAQGEQVEREDRR
jgi:RNA polymerase sigma factor (sigma-70 family)